MTFATDGRQIKRQMKTDWILRVVHFAGIKGYSKEKLIVDFCINFNSSKKTAVEIIELLISSEKIREENKILYSKESWINKQFASQKKDVEIRPVAEGISGN